MTEETPNRHHAHRDHSARASWAGGDVFAPGNNYHELARNYFSSPASCKFKTADELLERVLGYFQWADDNPLMETRVASDEGTPTTIDVPKMRALSKEGMLLYVGVDRHTWARWRNNPNVRDYLKPVIEFAEKLLYQRKFDGAAAGLLNATIISRDLNLAEKHELSGPGGKPMVMATIDWSKVPTDAMQLLHAAMTVDPADYADDPPADVPMPDQPEED